MSARYTVTEPLGRGTRVFRGVAESVDGHKRDVAIMRVLPSLITNQKFVDMFLADLRSSLLLKHANIVDVLDIARTPEGAYFVVRRRDLGDLGALRELGRRLHRRVVRAPFGTSTSLCMNAADRLRSAGKVRGPSTYSSCPSLRPPGRKPFRGSSRGSGAVVAPRVRSPCDWGDRAADADTRRCRRKRGRGRPLMLSRAGTPR